MAAADAVLFCISQQSLNARRERDLCARIAGACPLPSRIVRLEGTGAPLHAALDALASEGRRSILVQPLGLPFSQSLTAWLPGVLAHWRDQHGGPAPDLFIGEADVADAGIHAAVQAALGVTPRRHVGCKPSLGKSGWDNPPDFTHHLLVCTGPRCNYHGAPNLALALKEELRVAGIAGACLIATTGCLYPCNRGPLLALYPRGAWYRLPDQPAVSRFVKHVLVDGGEAHEHVVHRVAPLPRSVPQQGETS